MSTQAPISISSTAIVIAALKRGDTYDHYRVTSEQIELLRAALPNHATFTPKMSFTLPDGGIFTLEGTSQDNMSLLEAPPLLTNDQLEVIYVAAARLVLAAGGFPDRYLELRFNPNPAPKPAAP